MKIKILAAALAALTLGASLPAAAQTHAASYRDGGYNSGFHGDQRWRRAAITIRMDGREFSVDRGDRMFHRLVARPYSFQPGLTYAYTDRCNRFGCVAFVFDNHHRRPIDRIFAPHLNRPGHGWRQARGFDDSYQRFGRYDRDDRDWNNDNERGYRGERDDQRDGRGERRGDGGWNGERQLEGGPSRR